MRTLETAYQILDALENGDRSVKYKGQLISPKALKVEETTWKKTLKNKKFFTKRNKTALINIEIYRIALG